eukprot:TRINITY_DN26116_c0_g1_i1.p1 TRINITY_DN26116_c0_g1~~TRINITY_DN26116_c0_g1_i1.p1  ORF type:complete len:506 (+),score=126.34 TRINITY_DN26116_c0_g1_i1:49-1566(+)
MDEVHVRGWVAVWSVVLLFGAMLHGSAPASPRRRQEARRSSAAPAPRPSPPPSPTRIEQPATPPPAPSTPQLPRVTPPPGATADDCSICPVSGVGVLPPDGAWAAAVGSIGANPETKPFASARGVCVDVSVAKAYPIGQSAKRMPYNVAAFNQMMPAWADAPRPTAGASCCWSDQPLLLAPVTYTIGHNPVHTFFDGYFSFWLWLLAAEKQLPVWTRATQTAAGVPTLRDLRVLLWFVPNASSPGSRAGVGGWLSGFADVALTQFGITADRRLAASDTVTGSQRCVGACAVCSRRVIVPRKVGAMDPCLRGLPLSWQQVSDDIRRRAYAHLSLPQEQRAGAVRVALYGRQDAASRRLTGFGGSFGTLATQLAEGMRASGMGAPYVLWTMGRTFAEQIRAYSTFDVLVTIGGANELNALFMPHGSVVLQFIRCTRSRSFLSRYLRPDQGRFKFPMCSRTSPVNRSGDNFGITREGFLTKYGPGLLLTLAELKKTRFSGRPAFGEAA